MKMIFYTERYTTRFGWCTEEELKQSERYKEGRKEDTEGLGRRKWFMDKPVALPLFLCNTHTPTSPPPPSPLYHERTGRTLASSQRVLQNAILTYYILVCNRSSCSLCFCFMWTVFLFSKTRARKQTARVDISGSEWALHFCWTASRTGGKLNFVKEEMSKINEILVLAYKVMAWQTRWKFPTLSFNFRVTKTRLSIQHWK